MGKLWRQNWKIAAGTSPTLADEPGEVLTFGQQVTGALASGDIVGGNGIDVVSSGTGASEVLVISTASGVTVGGAVINNVAFFPTSPDSAGADDYFCILTGAGAFSFTLPASPVTGRTVVVKDGVGDAFTANKTILPDTGTIDNQGSAILAASGASLGFIYDGTEWKTF